MSCLLIYLYLLRIFWFFMRVLNTQEGRIFFKWFWFVYLLGFGGWFEQVEVG